MEVIGEDTTSFQALRSFFSLFFLRVWRPVRIKSGYESKVPWSWTTSLFKSHIGFIQFSLLKKKKIHHGSGAQVM